MVETMESLSEWVSRSSRLDPDFLSRAELYAHKRDPSSFTLSLRAVTK
ncbi:hypothetical protein YUYDRAFT_01854 [Streptomyces sp. ScaeMP-e48]|nr:hypothetical protein YUYDRAFT_01854 [Streptomyces sp. ScaeMP-e48]